jgi:hypothetical protein
VLKHVQIRSRRICRTVGVLIYLGHQYL